MAFPGAEKLLDFAVPFDVPLLDQIISAFYTPGADPTMVRSRSLSLTYARMLPAVRFAGPSSRRPTTGSFHAQILDIRCAFREAGGNPRIVVRDFSDRKRETRIFLTLLFLSSCTAL